MRKNMRIAFAILPILLFALGFVGFAFSQDTKKEKPQTIETAPSKKVYLIKIEAPITPVVAEYIVKSIDKASEQKAEALIIQLNTPGGLVDSTLQIIMKMMSANVPTVVYVAPSGARAASAGVFITLSANIAAMAPTTHIGAAHPVQLEGKMDKTMEQKAVNDLAAMVRGIAEKRGKNIEWAEEAVRESVSITETEALKKKVIDLVSPDIPSLVAAINGKTVEVALGKKTINTKGAEVQELEMGFRYRLLEIISNPNIAYILMILGFYGLYFELSNPGSIFPGVAGAICLILAFYALHTLPINYAGLLLIILGITLFIAEAFITSHGILGVGGTIAMLLGSVMLIDSASPFLRISWAVIIPAVIISAVLFIITVMIAIRVQREKPDTGMEGMLHLQAIAKTDIHETGQVFLRGEFWNAKSNEPIAKGETVIVLDVEGLTLKVAKNEPGSKSIETPKEG
ncbi:MAG: nodulation protein NfeD [Nitrospirota bacterium]